MLQFQWDLSKGNILYTFIVPILLFCIFREILKRDLVHSTILPSDNKPQGTGQIQTHSSCTFSCKLQGLHLSGRRNGQVTQWHIKAEGACSRDLTGVHLLSDLSSPNISQRNWRQSTETGEESSPFIIKVDSWEMPLPQRMSRAKNT